jgi:hypothetical protein
LQSFVHRLSGLARQVFHLRRFGFGCCARCRLGALCRRLRRCRRRFVGIAAFLLQPRIVVFQFGDARLG